VFFTVHFCEITACDSDNEQSLIVSYINSLLAVRARNCCTYTSVCSVVYARDTTVSRCDGEDDSE